jgi:hypothetical protein
VGKRPGLKVGIGAPDPSLTGVSGMAAVTELCERLDVVGALDGAVGPIKRRARGYSAGQLLVGLAAVQLVGEDPLVGLDRHRADAAGQAVTPVAGLCSTTAAGVARGIGEGRWCRVETGLATVSARMLARLPAARREALLAAVTIDLDTTDVEVYGRGKRGVAYHYQGQRCGRPHVATWAEADVALAADLLAGNEDPRRGAPGLLLRRALGALPPGVRRIRLRADGGYFAVELAIAAHREGVGFADRGQADRGAVAHPGRSGRDRLDRGDRYARRPARRRRLSSGLVAHPHRPADPPGPPGWRADRRRPSGAAAAHPAPRPALPALDELACADAVYGYSFILTNLDVSTPEHAAAVEHWYRHRTEIEKDARRQTRSRPAPPPLGIRAGPPSLDGGRADRHQPRRLLTPAHRHPRPRRRAARLGYPRRQSDDRHPATPTPPHPRPPRAPRRPTHPAPTPGPPPAHRDPDPATCSPLSILTRPYRPRTPPEPRSPEVTLGSLPCPQSDNASHTTPKRSTS